MLAVGRFSAIENLSLSVDDTLKLGPLETWVLFYFLKMIEYIQNNAVISGDMKISLEIYCFDFNKRELCRHYFNSYTRVLYYFPLKKYLLVMQPVGF
jgi:hypothetical protein